MPPPSDFSPGDTDQVLGVTEPGDPLDLQPTKVRLVINGKTVKPLDLADSESLRSQIDKGAQR